MLLLQTTYGRTPAVALFATNARYKREAYRGSEFAPKILAEAGIRVVMKSDHPVINSRYLVFEAQQAHYYGLSDNLALASVTTTPAEVVGLDHRIGYVKKGYDADIVVWDSHPLTLGATPKQVWVDGVQQLAAPYTVEKPEEFQRVPKTPSWDKEAQEALDYEGLPPLEPKKSVAGTVIFTNVREVFLPDGKHGIQQLIVAQGGESGTVIIKEGKIVCRGTETSCIQSTDKDATVVDLEGGSLSPG
jgi:imidazolonepropionase-like amidohydrolase